MADKADLVPSLNAKGVSVLAQTTDLSKVGELCNQLNPHILIFEVDIFTEQCAKAIKQLHVENPVPTVVLVEKDSPGMIEAALDAGVSSYLICPVSEDRLVVAIELAEQRFNRWQALQQELQAAKAKLSERKLVERAKGILMQQKQLSEDEAYKQMRKAAMDNGVPIVKLAKKIILVFEMMD